MGDREAAIIDFQGTKVYSSSFLEESFGGVIREAKTGQEAEINRRKLKRAKFINMDSIWKEKLNGYIQNAKHRVKGANANK